jgi:hypothetical protein
MCEFAFEMRRRKFQDSFVVSVALDPVTPSLNSYSNKNWDLAPTYVEVSTQRNRKTRLRVMGLSDLTLPLESVLEKIVLFYQTIILPFFWMIFEHSYLL